MRIISIRRDRMCDNDIIRTSGVLRSRTIRGISRITQMVHRV